MWMAQESHPGFFLFNYLCTFRIIFLWSPKDWRCGLDICIWTWIFNWSIWNEATVVRFSILQKWWRWIDGLNPAQLVKSGTFFSSFLVLLIGRSMPWKKLRHHSSEKNNSSWRKILIFLLSSVDFRTVVLELCCRETNENNWNRMHRSHRIRVK